MASPFSDLHFTSQQIRSRRIRNERTKPHFIPHNSLNDISTDTDYDSDLVADAHPDALIRIVRP